MEPSKENLLGAMYQRAAALILVCVMAACGPHQRVYERVQKAGPAALPEPVKAVPAFKAALPRPLAPTDLLDLNATEGVAVVAPVAVERLPVVGGNGRRVVLRVAAVDPLKIRSLMPPATRDADFVWASLLAGEAVVTFAAADKLGLDGGGEIGLPGYDATVGAFADNGSPNFADVLVDAATGAKIGMGRSKLVMIGVDHTAALPQVSRRIRSSLKGARLQPLTARRKTRGRAPRATGNASGSLIGVMNFTVARGGFISPDPAWVRANIADFTVPIVGMVRCHRVMAYQLHAALSEVVERGLADEIRPDDYGGCFVPRFIDRDPSKPLSMHAFGLAIDFNVSTNRLGTYGDFDARVVAIFERWGFRWGGRWSRPDPMHFELARIIQP